LFIDRSTRRPLSLRLLLILLICAGLLPLAMLGMWGIKAVVDQHHEDLERATLDMSRALASAVDAEIESTVAALVTLSYHPALAAGRLEEFYHVSRDAVRARPYWRSVILTDGTGGVIFRSSMPFGAKGVRLTDPDSLGQLLKEKRPLVGQVREGQRGGLALPVRIPVVTGGKVQYVVSAALLPDRIHEILARQDIPPGWVITVADPRNQRLARSPEHSAFVGKPVTRSLVELMASVDTSGNGTALNGDGVESVAGITKLPRWGISVIVGAPTSLLDRALWTALAMYAAALALSLVACLGAARAISRRIIGGINHLQQQASDLGQGRPVQSHTCGIQEIDHLAQSLQAASVDRLAVEHQREVLLGNLNRSLGSLRVALDQAQEAARAKDHFLAVLGHELRNPLAPIVSTLDLMDLRGGDVYQRERQILRRQATHLHRLVDDLLDVSRIVQGKLSLNTQPVLLNALVARAHESILATVPKRSAPLTLALPPHDVWVQGDEARLQQLVVNLLGNAVRHSPDAPVRVAVSGSGTTATIVVADAGTGMSPDVLEKIFTPFYQAPQSIARSTGGLGLGLTIARSIVDMHGGTITAHSAGLGWGCEFRVELPLGREAIPAAPSVPWSAPRQAARILVVDDNIDAAATIAEALAVSGHDVRVAHSATAALSTAADFTPAIAILDIGLPDMDGFTLARRLRASGLPSELLLIAITGYGQLEDRQRAMQAGFDLHLTKPVALGALLDGIETLRAARAS
jgi:signal transduction histidine kinase